MNKKFYTLFPISIIGIIGISVIASASLKNINKSETLTQEQLNEQSVLAVNWFQQSGEYVALAHQAFNLARISFDQAVAKKITNPAVIVDIDETVLNNGAYQASLINTNNSFNSASWNAWIKAKKATAVPGSVEFINYVNRRQGKVFFISDRNESSTNNSKNNDLEAATIANLKSVGFSNVNDNNVLLKGEFPKTISGKEDTSKQWRREAVSKGLADGKHYNVVILVGDNLDDLDNKAGTLNNERRRYVETRKSQYGLSNTNSSKNSVNPVYVVLPNPMYGAWEAGLYNPSVFGKKQWFQLSPSEKDQQRKDNLIR